MIVLREAIEKKCNKFDEGIRSAKSQNVGMALLREKKKWLCHNDLFYLCKITGHNKIAELPDIYKPFCDDVSLMNWKILDLKIFPKNEDMLGVNEICTDRRNDLKYHERMYLAYRAFYKTTIISKVHTIQLLLNFPDIHVVLCHNKQENASDILVSIKNCFLSTELGALFPELIPKSKDWGNRTGFSVATRKDMGRTEENVEAVGVDTEITGRHWQVAKKNDLVTEKSVTTDEQLRKTASWDERFNLGMFDDQKTRLQDYEGTRYHHADLYSSKLSDPFVKVTEIPVLVGGDDTGAITHPQRFRPEDIERMKKDLWTFYCQMLLKPKDPSKMQFNSNMILTHDGTYRKLYYYLLCDPASRRKKDNDFTVMLVIGIDSKGCKYIVDGIRDKLDPKQRIDHAIDLIVRWNIKLVGWEAIAFMNTDCFYLEERRRKEHMAFNIIEISSHNSSKEDRIRSLIPEYADHKWYWPERGAIRRYSVMTSRTYCLTEEMERELVRFPLGEHDDLLDTMTFLNYMDVSKPEADLSEEESVGTTFKEYIGAIDSRNEYLRRNPWSQLDNNSLRYVLRR